MVEEIVINKIIFSLLCVLFVWFMMSWKRVVLKTLEIYAEMSFLITPSVVLIETWYFWLYHGSSVFAAPIIENTGTLIVLSVIMYYTRPSIMGVFVEGYIVGFMNGLVETVIQTYQLHELSKLGTVLFTIRPIPIMMHVMYGLMIAGAVYLAFKKEYAYAITTFVVSVNIHAIYNYVVNMYSSSLVKAVIIVTIVVILICYSVLKVLEGHKNTTIQTTLS